MSWRYYIEFGFVAIKHKIIRGDPLLNVWDTGFHLPNCLIFTKSTAWIKR